MQIFTSFAISKEEYERKVLSWEIDKPERCSTCGRSNSFYRHGYYYRYVVDSDSESKIPVARFFCTACRHTTSVIPNFCVPKFQHSAAFILEALKLILNRTLIAIEERLRSLFYFYKKRFMRNLPLCEVFLREEGIREVFPEDKRKRAIKIYDILTSLPKEAGTPFQRVLKSIGKHFMAK